MTSWSPPPPTTVENAGSRTKKCYKKHPHLLEQGEQGSENVFLVTQVNLKVDKDHPWIVDTGASGHQTNQRTILFDVRQPTADKIYSNGNSSASTVKVELIGTVRSKAWIGGKVTNITLKNVKYALQARTVLRWTGPRVLLQYRWDDGEADAPWHPHRRRGCRGQVGQRSAWRLHTPGTAHWKLESSLSTWGDENEAGPVWWPREVEFDWGVNEWRPRISHSMRASPWLFSSSSQDMLCCLSISAEMMLATASMCAVAVEMSKGNLAVCLRYSVRTVALVDSKSVLSSSTLLLR